MTPARSAGTGGRVGVRQRAAIKAAEYKPHFAGSEGQGSDTESEGGEREMRARSIAAGAAVGLAAHLLLRLRHPAGDCVAGDAPGSVPYDWLESPYATVQAACITCMPLLNTAQELQSTSGMLNAFQALQNAARVALPQPAGRPWVVGAAAEGAAAERAQQAMCAAAVAVAKVALVAMTVATEERVRVAARNAMQVRPPATVQTHMMWLCTPSTLLTSCHPLYVCRECDAAPLIHLSS